jgi:antitoxin component YwqK of YwqJK toxin-antitoxin module
MFPSELVEMLYEKNPEVAKSYGKLQRQSEISNDGKRNGTTKEYLWGNLIYISQYVNGMKEGLEKKFYSNNGKLESEIQYEQGKMNGSGKSYHENGKLRTEARFKDDNPVGTMKAYRDNGELMATVTLNDKGLPVSGICHNKDGSTRALTEAEFENSSANFDCE